jgi:3-hydroxyacyl-CoA dehydrogenase
MPDSVRSEDRDGVRVVWLDNPPVNAFSHAQRAAVDRALTDGLADDDVEAFVIAGAGKIFSAGADIREFDGDASMRSPHLPELIARIEECAKPVVVALHGTALGGACELALGCHGRVAAEGTRIGLPEVTLGIVPGAGGTQRLPRLIGVAAALDVIVTGKPVSAEKALALRLVDLVVPTGRDLVRAAVEMALELAGAGTPPPRTRDRNEHVADTHGKPGLFDDYRQRVGKAARGFEAPLACIDCIEASVTRPFAEGVAIEREAFQRCRASIQSKAQRHVFFAEREARKVRGVGPDIQELPVRGGAVLGCGTMGGGIAMCFANAGIPVVVTETEQAALDRGMDAIRKTYASAVSKGRMSREDADETLTLIEPALELDAVADADVVIEAVFEDMALKQDIFGRLDRICRPDALLATNTSSLDVNEIASVTSRPERVLGMHFFSPANIMRLLEIVRADRTSPEALATAMALSQRLGKVGVVVGVCDSFAANRMLYPYVRQAQFLVEEGALPEQVDRVIHDFGFPMGPFAMGDLAGLDVGWRVRQHREPTRPKHLRYSAIADELYHMGRHGQKTGAGWYRYEKGDRTPIPDPEVTELIIATSAKLGIERREISDEEILQRCMYPLVNEGAKILDEGIAERPSDLDLVWIYGYGFPRYRGGPMFYADTVGVAHVHETMQRFHATHGDWLEPAPLLATLAREGRTFADWRAP